MERKHLRETAEKLHIKLASYHKFQKKNEIVSLNIYINAAQIELQRFQKELLSSQHMNQFVLEIEKRISWHNLQIKNFKKKSEKFFLRFRKHCFSKTISVK